MEGEREGAWSRGWGGGSRATRRRLAAASAARYYDGSGRAASAASASAEVLGLGRSWLGSGAPARRPWCGELGSGSSHVGRRLELEPPAFFFSFPSMILDSDHGLPIYSRSRSVRWGNILAAKGALPAAMVELSTEISERMRSTAEDDNGQRRFAGNIFGSPVPRARGGRRRPRCALYTRRRRGAWVRGRPAVLGRARSREKRAYTVKSFYFFLFVNNN